MSLSQSQIEMWKTVVSLVHADGKVHEAEDQFLKERFAKLPLTDEQRQELFQYIEYPEEPREVFQRISEPRDRAQLIYFARLLFYSDGDYSAQEKHILELLNSEVMSKVDMQAAMHKMDQIVLDFKAKEEARKEAQPLHRKIINAIVFWVDLDNMHD